MATYVVKAGQKIQPVINKLKSGDELTISPGVYKEKISIKTSTITVNGSCAALDGNNKGGTLLTIKGKNITINGLEIRNLCGLDACGVNILPGCEYVSLNNVSVHNIECPIPKKKDHCANAILGYADTNQAIKNILLNACDIYNIVSGWSEAISFYGYCRNIIAKELYVANCSNIGIDFCGNYGDNPNKDRDYPVCIVVKDSTFENCKNTSYDPQSASAIYIDGAQNVIIQGNSIRNSDCGIEAGAEEKVNVKYSTKNINIFDNVINGCINGIKIGGYEKDLGCVYDIDVLRNQISVSKAAIQLAKLSGCTIKSNNLTGKVCVGYEWGDKSTHTSNVFRADNITKLIK